MHIVAEQKRLDTTAHDQAERGAALSLLDDDTKEADLWHVRHERVRGFEPADVREGGHFGWRGCGSGRVPRQSYVQHTFGQTHLAHEVERRRLQHVAPKVALEIVVCLKQDDANALSG